MAFKIDLKKIFGARVQKPADPEPTVAYELVCASLALAERLLADRGDGLAPLSYQLKTYLYTARLNPDEAGARAAVTDLEYVLTKIREDIG